jgi:PAS domain S-box-containing protein
MRNADGIEHVLPPAASPNAPTDGSPSKSFEWDALVSAVVAPPGDDELRETRQQFLSLFYDAPVACHEIDRDGTVVRVNAAEGVLLGIAPAEMIGRPIWDFMALEERESSSDSLRKKLSGEQPLTAVDRKYTRGDGTTIYLEIHPKLILNAAGEIIGIRSFMIDISERKRIQYELESKAAELARSNGELEQFAYVASHDLQEPLRKILAFSDRLKTKCGDMLSEEGKDYLGRMNNAAARMQTLIQDLLALSRVATQPHPFGPVDLQETAKHVVSDLESRTERLGGRVEIGALPAIIADRPQMTQLFQNLIGNALKFSRPGVPPVVRVSSEHINHEDAPPACRIVFEDNGIGFEEKHSNRIFQVFQRLHGRGEYEGSGIGLSICRKIAERHGGSITATSTPGQGSKFTVVLPLRPTQDR